uniref:carboxypeptidase-like regulatory domain-containing protein n=1 Tax=Bordetella sputigena TaxID=1416810 RepID=UPI0039EF0E23
MMKTIRFRRSLAAMLMFGAGLSVAYADMPPVQQVGNIQYVSGGIGLDESTSMKAAEKDYSLSMVFAQHLDGQNAYAADVPITITDSKGAIVLQTTTSGPYLLVKLPPGTYKITSTYNGKAMTRQATVSKGSHARIGFEWQ